MNIRQSIYRPSATRRRRLLPSALCRRLLSATRRLLLCLLALLLTTACSKEAATVPDGSPSGPKAQVTLRIGTATATRAWSDANAAADRSEMMHSWVVIIRNSSGTEVYRQTGTPADDHAEIDDVGTVTLTAGETYTAYSFANIGTAWLDAHPDFETATATVAGNRFDPSAADNGFGTKGIPMSNKQTFTAVDGMTKDLIVVRMLAKMELRITNTTTEAVTVASATLSDITANGADNLKLLPRYDTTNGNYTVGGVNAEDDMEARHGVLQPNLDTSAATAALELPVGKTLAAGESTTLTFYVNESATPQNAYQRFYLTLTLDKDDSKKEYRYALIDDENATGNSGSWDYIARNDYRVLPLAIDDYTIDIIPYDFPPIGVYPCSVKDEDGLFTVTFHDYGHFHLVPVVRKMSTGATIGYGTGSGDYWTLKTDWATSFRSWTDHTKTAVATDDGTFYVGGSTATADGAENGGFPAFDTTTSWNGITPYIFGNIAPATADKKIYHELTVSLRKASGTPREMLVRIYMMLDL